MRSKRSVSAFFRLHHCNIRKTFQSSLNNLENMNLPIRSHNSSIPKSLALGCEITRLFPKKLLISFEEKNRELIG